MTKSCKVSVIMPCFNHGEFLPEAVASVKNANREDIELIVIDDGSTDERTRREMDTLRAQAIRVIRQENRGLGAARNAGVAASQGEYLFPLDADDRMRSAWIDRAIGVLESDPRVGVVYGDAQCFGAHTRQWKTGPFERDRLLYTNFIHASALYRRLVWEQNGGYDETMPVQGMEDWDFWVGALERGWRFHYLGEIFFDYRRANESMLTGARQAHDHLQEFVARKHSSLYRQAWLSLVREREQLFNERQSVKWNLRNLHKVLSSRMKARTDESDRATGDPSLHHECERAMNKGIARRARNKVSFMIRRAKWRRNRGYCPTCDGEVWFSETGPWLRDQYLCSRCGSIPRQRALIKILNEHFPRWRELRIHESSPDGPSSDKLRRECRNYVSSQFFPDVPRGQFQGEQRSENLEAQTFADKSFDLVITQDVFEHVLRPEKAFAEIARTLRPEGAHVYTVPYYRGKRTVVRAQPGIGGITYLLEPDYHHNPIDPAGSLVITEWGDELCDFVFRFSGMTTTILNFYDPRFGLKGEFLDVLISRKSSAAEIMWPKRDAQGHSAHVGKRL